MSVIIILDRAQGVSMAVGDGRRMRWSAEQAWQDTLAVVDLVTLGVDCLMQETQGLSAQDTTRSGGGSGIGSPTEAAALRKDQAAADLRALGKHLRQMESASSAALKILNRAVVVPDLPGADHPEYWCVSCAGHGHRTVPVHPGLKVCLWCQRWRQAHAMQLPPIEVVNAHHEGKPITAKLYAKLLVEQGKRRKGRGKKQAWSDPHKPNKAEEVKL
jgi:hypothetical protein